MLVIAHDIVIDKEDELLLEAGNFIYDIFNRSSPVLIAKETRDGTKITIVRTASRGLDDCM